MNCCCWKWFTTSYFSSSSELTKDLLNEDEKTDNACDIAAPSAEHIEEHTAEPKSEPSAAPNAENIEESNEESDAESANEESDAESANAESANEEPSADPTVMDKILEDDGTGSESDTCTEIDDEDSIFEEAYSEGDDERSVNSSQADTETHFVN